MRKCCGLAAGFISTLALVGSVHARGLSDILDVDQAKESDLAKKEFKSKTFESANYNGLKTFNAPDFPLGGKSNQQFGRDFPVSSFATQGEASLFTGKTYVPAGNPFADEMRENNALSGRRYESLGSANLLGDDQDDQAKNFSKSSMYSGEQRYAGPELQRKTAETKVLESALKRAAEDRGDKLTISEIKQILNKSY